MRAEGTDGRKRLKGRIVRAEQTGEKEVTAAQNKTKGRVKSETKLTEKRGMVRGKRREKDKSEEGLLTLAVSQAICVTMFHVLLKG